MLPALDLDRPFVDFNCSQTLDPAMRAKLLQAHLYEMVYAARQADRRETLHFADVMRCTLREVTFEAFERAHGPRAVTYSDWFYCKLKQFLEILTYERLIAEGIPHNTETEPLLAERPWEGGFYVSGSIGPAVDEEVLKQAFSPEDAETFDWPWFIQEVSTASNDRDEVLQHMLEDLAAKSAPKKSREWSRNKERNLVIRNCLARGADIEEICRELDKRTIAALPIMERYGIQSYVVALADPNTRNAIQQLVSKVGKSANPVKL